MPSDTRGFQYALEPLRQRRGWQLDAAMSAVGKARKRLSDAESAHRRMQKDVLQQAGLAATEWSMRLDPVAHARSLTYLTRLRQSQVSLESEIAGLRDELAAARREAARRQQGVETLERHRSELFDVHRLDQERKSSAQADQDWISRNSIAQRSSR